MDPAVYKAVTYDTAIIILNYRTPELTIRCLEALSSEIAREPTMCAVVVDNCSADQSFEKIKCAIVERGWNWAEAITTNINGGFSFGNNIGMQEVDADFYILMNSDTLILPGAIDELRKASDKRPDAGIISPRLLLEDGTLHHSCYRFMTPMSELLNAASTGIISRLFQNYVTTLPHPNTPSEPEWTSFACVMVRKRMINEIGYMDEGYFMYFEDQDYCHRARCHGWSVLNWPYAKVVHSRGKSGPVRSLLARKERPPRYYYAARTRYFRKYFGYTGLWRANLCWTVGRLISLAREKIGEKAPHTCQRAGRDIWTNLLCPMCPTAIPPREFR